MSKVWFCRQCGYEVPGRGRCHVCKQRLLESPLPELEAGAEEDEVGYRLEDWADHSRGALIVALIEANVPHRFEEDELVVGAEDEERVDDLTERIATEAAIEEEERVAELPPDELSGDVEMLLGASRRLVDDPTDMQADADALESSSAVFMAEDWSRTDPDTWAAVGRVTRRLLAALGADDALEDEIKLQAAILTKLLAPSFEPIGYGSNGSGAEPLDESEEAALAAAAADLLAAQADEDGETEEGVEAASVAAAAPASDADATADVAATSDAAQEDEDDDEDEDDEEAETAAVAADEAPARSGRRFGLRRRRGQEAPVVDDTDEDDEDDASDEGSIDDDESAESGATDENASGDDDTAEEDDEAEQAGDDREGESVYELPDWLPEQRAHLSIMMDGAGITYLWESGDLIVPLARDTEVEELFGQVQGVQIEEDDEARYRAMESLFAATDRFLNDPDSQSKAAEVVRAVEAADGPTPVGIDDAQWWTIRQQAKALAAAIEADASLEQIYSDTKDLRDELRPLM